MALSTTPQLTIAPAARQVGAITRMAFSHDEAYCFVASEHGHLAMLEMRGDGSAARERIRRRDEEIGSEVDTVLVSRSELLERLDSAHDLEHKLKEQQMQAEGHA